MAVTLNKCVYLAQVESGRFLVKIDAGRSELEITDYPSVAQHMSYAEAEQTVQRLRRRGFRQSVVANVLGVPVSADDLRTALENERATSVVADPLPKNLRDLHNISAAETKRRYKREPEFAKRVDEIQARLGR